MFEPISTDEYLRDLMEKMEELLKCLITCSCDV